jgi:protein ImuB
LVRGEAVEEPLPVPDLTFLTEAIDLDYSVDRLEPLSFVVKGLLSRLLERLETRRLACGDLHLELDLEGGNRQARRVGVTAPTLDLRVLMRLISHALETHPPEGPVVGLCLETEGRPVQRDQLDLFRPSGPTPAVLGNTLTELEALCGSGRVGAPRIADDHRPDAFAIGPFQPRPGAPIRSAPSPHGNPQAKGPGTEPPLALRALRPPVAAQVVLRGGQPQSIRSAIASGQVLSVAGPWRTTGGWWSREGRFAYDSFDVLTSDGTVARLRYDHVHKAWQIDAVYD